MMATGKNVGSVTKRVPSWLNSPAWSNTPSNVVKAKSAYNCVDSPSKERGKSEQDQPVTGDEFPEVSKVTPNEGQGKSIKEAGGNTGHSNGNGLLAPSVQAWSTESSAASVASSAPLGSGSPSNRDHPFGKNMFFDSRVELFTLELSRKRIHIAELQRMSSQGIPDAGGIRATTWKLLLGYLPRNHDDWTTELAKKRAEYAVFREELLLNPSEISRRKSEAEVLEAAANCVGGKGVFLRQEISHDDHPLSLRTESVWNQFFQDTELSEQIDRDVKRTHPDIQFFCGDSTYALENQNALKRALFIFAKLNPGIRYVQGMNEVLAPLFYVFKTDIDEANASHAEADAFFCFVELLSDFRDHFCQQLDNSAVGIRSTISQLNALLKRNDEELWRHLEITSKVNPQFYAFRWITLLLTQEFDFPDCLRLWDSILSNPDGPLEILLRVCCAMLLCVRSRLLAGDFTTNLKLLQNYPSVYIHHLLAVAEELRE